MAAGPIAYGRLCKPHPRLDLLRIRMLKALYKGGHHLLGDAAVMEQVLGKIGDESEQIYRERKRRAFYENLFAMVINQTSAGLAQDPCRLTMRDDSSTEYWEEFSECATAHDDEGGDERSLDQVSRDIAVEALVCGWSWAQLDLPALESEREEPSSLFEQEDSGLLSAYLVPWPTEAVLDWSEYQGKLRWVRTYECIVDDEDPAKLRDLKTHVFVIWDATGWTRYEVLEGKDHPLPNPEIMISPASEGTHNFGRVPWFRFDVCRSGAYLHIGDLIESLCRQYFNRCNGEAWQWTQYSFQQLYEFLAPEIGGIDTPVSEAQSNPARAKRGRRAPGVVHERGHEDRAEYIGPDVAGAAAGRAATQDIRDAVLRVVAQMALSQDTSGAMLRRSGDSKKQDSVAQEILLGAIGKHLLVYIRQIVRAIAALTNQEMPEVRGYERFNITDVDDVLNQAVLAESIDIPSATYKLEEKYRTAITHLGDGISDDIRSKIYEELSQAITQDQFMPSKAEPVPPELQQQEQEPVAPQEDPKKAKDDVSKG